jgi:uncharacterized membrane protein YqjE
MPNIAAMITLLLTGQPWQYELMLHGWLVEPTSTQVQFYTTLSWLGLGVVALIGVLWLLAMVRRSRDLQRASPPVRAYRVATARHFR